MRKFLFYNLIRSDHHSGSKKGGVCIYHKKHISLIRYDEVCPLESWLVIEIRSQTEKCFQPVFLTPHLVKVKKNSKSLAKILILFLVRSKMNFLSVHFLDQLERGPIWSLLLVIGLLVMQCSQKQLKIFLIFCMKLGDYEVRDRAGFLKKNLDLEIFAKRSPN